MVTQPDPDPPAAPPGSPGPGAAAPAAPGTAATPAAGTAAPAATAPPADLQPGALQHLLAGWRMGLAPGVGSDGLPHLDPVPAPGQSLFEAIEQSGQPDRSTYVLTRRRNTFAILNVFPYNPGHVMVLPRRAVPSLDDLADEVYVELWRLVREATLAVKAALRPDGLNIGVNEGQAGGGSVPDHLHVHIVPRWRADTNFATTVANTRVLPVSLAQTWSAIRAVWPGGPDGPGAPVGSVEP